MSYIKVSIVQIINTKCCIMVAYPVNSLKTWNISQARSVSLCKFMIRHWLTSVILATQVIHDKMANILYSKNNSTTKL